MIIAINQVYFAANIIFYYLLKKVFRVKNEKNTLNIKVLTEKTYIYITVLNKRLLRTLKPSSSCHAIPM